MKHPWKDHPINKMERRRNRSKNFRDYPRDAVDNAKMAADLIANGKSHNRRSGLMNVMNKLKYGQWISVSDMEKMAAMYRYIRHGKIPEDSPWYVPVMMAGGPETVEWARRKLATMDI